MHQSNSVGKMPLRNMAEPRSDHMLASFCCCCCLCSVAQYTDSKVKGKQIKPATSFAQLSATSTQKDHCLERETEKENESSHEYLWEVRAHFYHVSNSHLACAPNSILPLQTPTTNYTPTCYKEMYRNLSSFPKNIFKPA